MKEHQSGKNQNKCFMYLKKSQNMSNYFSTEKKLRQDQNAQEQFVLIYEFYHQHGVLNGIWVKGATCSGWSPPRVRSPMVAVTAKLPQTASCARIRIFCIVTKLRHIISLHAMPLMEFSGNATSFATKNQHGLFLVQKTLTLI